MRALSTQLYLQHQQVSVSFLYWTSKGKTEERPRKDSDVESSTLKVSKSTQSHDQKNRLRCLDGSTYTLKFIPLTSMANFSNSGSYIPQQGPSPSGMNFSTFGGGELPNISIHSGSDGTLPAHSMNSGIPLLNNLMFQTNPQALNVPITNDSYGALLLQAHMESMRAAQEAMKATVKMAVSNSDLAQKVEQLNATVQDLQRQLIMKNPHIP